MLQLPNCDLPLYELIEESGIKLMDGCYIIDANNTSVTSHFKTVLKSKLENKQWKRIIFTSDRITENNV